MKNICVTFNSDINCDIPKAIVWQLLAMPVICVKKMHVMQVMLLAEYVYVITVVNAKTAWYVGPTLLVIHDKTACEFRHPSKNCMWWQSSMLKLHARPTIHVKTAFMLKRHAMPVIKLKACNARRPSLNCIRCQSFMLKLCNKNYV